MRYEIRIESSQIGFPETVIEAGWDAIFTIKKDGEEAFYLSELKNDLAISCRALNPLAVFSGSLSAWDYFTQGDGDCTEYTVKIYGYCSDAWVLYWTGTFTGEDWKIDFKKKNIFVKPKESTPIGCIKAAWSNNVNIYNFDEPRVVLRFSVDYESTFQDEQIASYDEVTGSYNVCTPIDPPSPYWCFDELIETQQVDPSQSPPYYYLDCTTYYHRLTAEGTCSGSTAVPPDASGLWSVLTNGCPGTPPVYWRCPEEGELGGALKYGRLFREVFPEVIAALGCGLTVKSDFFNIAPDASAPSNKAYTFSTAYLQHLTIHQKSDIKRPEATNPAAEKVWTLKPKDLFSDLRTVFNARWRIEENGTVFRIEHVSYFDALPGEDYTAEANQHILEQDKTDFVKTTKFFYRDEKAGDDFLGWPIVLECGEGEQERRLSLFSMDVNFISSVDNAEAIGDEGFCLLSNQVVGPSLYLIEGNRPLSWPRLHENLHVYDVPGAALINDDPTIAVESLRKTRKQPNFSVRLCCDALPYDYASLKTTGLGDGQVIEAEYSMDKDLLTLGLKY
jgi:hypothetical protein